MSDLIVLCALDPFGAEALAKARDLDTITHRDPRILWLWGGKEPPPKSAAPGYLWTAGTDGQRLGVVPTGSLGGDFVRGEFLEKVGADVSAHLAAWNGELDLGKALPDEKLVHLILVGSLADPRTAVTAFAFFRAYCDNPSLWGGWRLRGAWAVGRNTGGLDLPEDVREAATAVSVSDLAEAIRRPASELQRDWLPVFPNYIAGNGARLADVLPTHSEASLLCAMSILGSVHDIRRRLPRESMFAVRHEEDTRASWLGQRPFSPEKPFAGIGTAVLRKSQRLFLLACGTILVRGILQQLRQQDPPEENWGPTAAGSDEMPSLLDGWSRDFLSEVSTGLARRSYRQTSSNQFAFSASSIRNTIGWEAFRTTFSERIEDVFGWSAFAKRPLELWDQALHELDAMADRFFFADRRVRLQQFVGASIESLDAALHVRVNQICDDCSTTEFPLPLQPHMVSRAFIGRAKSELEAIAEEDRRIRQEERTHLCSEDEVPAMESRLAARFGHLRKLVRKIPSPAALIVRIIIVFAVALFGFGIAEFTYYNQLTAQQAGLVRLAQAAVVTGVIACWILFRAFRLKADLREAFSQWFRLKLEYCRERHLRLELTTREELFAGIREYLHWLETEPDSGAWRPFPDFSHVSRSIAQTWPFHRTPLCEKNLSLFLHSYPRQIGQAIETADVQLAHFVERFTECRREFLLPYIPRGQEGLRKLGELVAKEYPRLAEGRGAALAEAIRLICRIRESRLDAPEIPALPYLTGRRTPGKDSVEWSGTFTRLPFADGDEAPGDASASDPTVETIAEFLRRHPGSLDQTLTRWLLEDVFESDSWAKVSNIHTRLWRLINESKNPPLSGDSSRPGPLLELWHPGESHFTDSFNPGKTAPSYDMKIDDDLHRPFYAIITLLPAMSGDEIVFGAGGKAAPDNLLGRRWLDATAKKEIPPVLQPIFPADV